jgi:hypothetical protein
MLNPSVSAFAATSRVALGEGYSARPSTLCRTRLVDQSDYRLECRTLNRSLARAVVKPNDW